ncbi:tRNA pseudouridine(55) synthase TruB [Scopulibacillus cellulosilyticus]|uniref:tRNA pseudouridine synthase B n=1 Tax=Scopulibacillus cellulosilyticus TaxID=2665665 RepID=A0ABW2PTA3_9BACL
MTDYHGILPLYKPRGMTSHDCVYKLRKLLNMKKIGHTGTLDPEVDGVLPMCIGRATKISEYLTAYPKSYDGVISLGTATATEDQTGEIIEQKDVTQPVFREEIESVFRKFTGEIEQQPPMYSAVKVKGKKLYEYAREGIEVERPVRNVTIYQLHLTDSEAYFEKEIPFSVDCSKGTYVRTLAVDIGRQLGYPAHLARLTRTRSGPFYLKECYTFDRVERAVEENNVANILSSIGFGLKFMASWIVDDHTANLVSNGAVLPKPKDIQNDIFTVYNRIGDCLAIYKQHPKKSGYIKPVKVLI